MKIEITDYESPNFRIGKSKIHGCGVFSRKRFLPGDFIGYHFVPSGITLLGRYLNHSENPNAISLKGDNGYDRVEAIKEIKKGEEITLDYRNRPDLEQPENFAVKN